MREKRGENREINWRRGKEIEKKKREINGRKETSEHEGRKYRERGKRGDKGECLIGKEV